MAKTRYFILISKIDPFALLTYLQWLNMNSSIIWTGHNRLIFFQMDTGYLLVMGLKHRLELARETIDQNYSSFDCANCQLKTSDARRDHRNLVLRIKVHHVEKLFLGERLELNRLHHCLLIHSSVCKRQELAFRLVCCLLSIFAAFLVNNKIIGHLYNNWQTILYKIYSLISYSDYLYF